ncbi:hypothetical protein EZS27_029300 [termite gut metagenome]|uniref:Bacterial mobilisation domain-containing protein n=1 Tax=termite gut metagenome TaxID=433724 RepID=A0A5J4QI80_9ZZZZ
MHYLMAGWYELMGQIRQLSGMANNVNQIARKANAAGYGEAYLNCIDTMKGLDNIIKRIEDGC